MTVTILPTYSGCPAMSAIKLDIETELAKAGFEDARVVVTNTPAWTTDLMSEAARDKLRAYGISPPERTIGKTRVVRALRQRRLSALRFALDRAHLGIRFDRVQGAVALPRLPRAVRSFQVRVKRP